MLIKDVRSIVRLIGEVAALSGGHAEKKRFLMDGLCRLIDADAWVWGLSCDRDPTKPQVYVSVINGGFSEEAFVRWLEALEHPGMVALASRFLMEVEKKKTHLTRLRDQMVDDVSFLRSDAHLLGKKPT